jgi:hypothetical protein
VKQLERLLVLQGQRCFFCNDPIPPGEASVEHLIASANGGPNEDGNCVVCCKSLNAAFGSKPYKDKLLAVLNHRGPFVCPKAPMAPTAVKSVPLGVEPGGNPQVSIVLANLQRRGASKPRKEQTLRNTIAAVFQQQLAEEELSALLARLQSDRYVSITDGKVIYNLPGNDA